MKQSEVLTTALPNGLKNTDLDHEHDRAYDDRAEGRSRYIVEVRGQERQSQDHKQTFKAQCTIFNMYFEKLFASANFHESIPF